MTESAPSSDTGWRGVPRAVWALGFVSLFMDVSSEMVHALLPLFLVSTLGASVAVVGAIEGIAEGTASATKLVSGAISDWLGRRKLLAIIGYGLGALTKPVFALAGSPVQVLGARFADRLGKGIRGAPRDALVADVTPPHLRGAAYGVRQALDTVGAFLGPLLAIALLVALDGDIRAVFALATIPGLVAVAVLAVGVEEPHAAIEARPQVRPRPRDLRLLGTPFWIVVAIGAVFTMARFSEAFLVLRARDAGMPLALVPTVMIAMNVVYAAASTPAGVLSDRFDRRLVLAGGLAALIAADLLLARGPNVPLVLVGSGLWGLHMGLSQGLLASLVADAAPENLRGTAFGAFHLVSGGALIAASVLAGFLWERHGPGAAFHAGAAFAAAALAGLLILVQRAPQVR
jgi:MFS family permease